MDPGLRRGDILEIRTIRAGGSALVADRIIELIQYHYPLNHLRFIPMYNTENKNTAINLERQWDRHVSHPLQSWAWGEFRKKTGVDVVRVHIASDNSQLTTYNLQLTFHRLPHLPFTIGYFPKGPEITESMLAALTKLGKEKNALFIQLEPNITIPHNPQPTIYNLQPSHRPLFTKYTFVLDLTRSEEELLRNMHSKTRYNIKIAQKHDVIIHEDSSENALREYLRLTQETTERQGFYAHTDSYHTKMWQTMSKAGIAKLFTAEYQGKILATWIIFAFSDTIYYPYGASSRDHREVMAPTLLLWEIAKWGKRNGYQKFDLWGAMGSHPDATDPFYGFHRFKEGFHPELVEFNGSFDLVINPILYRLYCMADDIRWKILKLKRH